ncbi:MAG: hypothetical protein RLZZ81_633 [Pseudomonadota bacterium]|jgi:hypothetical protein
MSKSDDSRYLDEEKKLLYTANNLCKRALEGFNNTKILEAQGGLTPLVISGYTTARSKLTQALLFGNTEACAPLSYFNQEGIGGVKSPYNQKLFLAIGSKLGNQKCTIALTKLQNNNYDVEKEANIWINHITHIRNLDQEITNTELTAITIFLKNDLIKHGIGLGVYDAHILIVKSETEIAETFVPAPAPKQSNYYDPHHNYTTTTTTNTYIPPEQPKQSVKPMGQHPQEKEGCEIC